MELTILQQGILVMFSEAGIPKNEAVALLTLLNEQEMEYITDKVIEMNKMPTEQELMEIMWPILMAKPSS